MVWLSKKELKVYLLVVGGISLAALLITFILLLPGYIRYNKKMVEIKKPVEDAIDISKFMIPPSYKKLRESSWIHFLPDKDKWTWGDIEPYWQDPKEIIIDYLEEQNENLISDIFKNIP